MQCLVQGSAEELHLPPLCAAGSGTAFRWTSAFLFQVKGMKDCCLICYLPFILVIYVHSWMHCAACIHAIFVLRVWHSSKGCGVLDRACGFRKLCMVQLWWSWWNSGVRWSKSKFMRNSTVLIGVLLPCKPSKQNFPRTHWAVLVKREAVSRTHLISALQTLRAVLYPHPMLPFVLMEQLVCVHG